ncbi:acyl-CoA dehydrogenase family protein [Chelatococcus reniformis]|uniref:Acyl-CoA dehydrogenase n=1 Tax=Chelatococcus reniformis TaxID=1494448 RepID=A0A916XQS8_9HYPH|nr:acyl-CoA dehydrogenase family protein [Chelatococcus reniformis]GGC91782.1 acyl-CoA dehydrogenase [Chelatococcus reniformis]
MSEMRDMFVETAERLLRDHCTPALLREAAATGELPAGLWAAMVDAGLTKAAVAEDAGGSGADLADALALLVPAGRHGAPGPLAETLLAGWLLGRVGIAVPDEPLALAVPRAGEVIRFSDGAEGPRLAGRVTRVPWARAASGGIVVIADGSAGPVLALARPAGGAVSPAANLAGEPRDDVAFDGAAVEVAAASPVGRDEAWALGAAARSAQMAGALQTVLALSVQYAQDRVQFGKPLAKLQVIQQNLAIIATQAAAAAAGADAAIEAAGHDLSSLAIGAAKARAGEAASIACNIAHQVHGAIGFTREHALHVSTQRLWSWRDEFGNDAFWQQRLGERAVAAGADGLWAMITAAA